MVINNGGVNAPPIYMGGKDLKKESVESLRKYIESLESKIKFLEEENQKLVYENQVLVGREDFVQDMYAEYRKMLDDITEIKAKYTQAVEDTYKMRDHYEKLFREHIKNIKKR